MKITSKILAWVCVSILVLYPIVAIVWDYLASGSNYGIVAALLAANAGTAFLVRLVFGLPELEGHTSEELRLFVLIIGVASGLASAVYWVVDEVDHVWLVAGIIAPVLVILLALMWFVDKVNKEGTKHEGK